MEGPWPFPVPPSMTVVLILVRSTELRKFHSCIHRTLRNSKNKELFVGNTIMCCIRAQINHASGLYPLRPAMALFDQLWHQKRYSWLMSSSYLLCLALKLQKAWKTGKYVLLIWCTTTWMLALKVTKVIMSNKCLTLPHLCRRISKCFTLLM